MKMVGATRDAEAAGLNGAGGEGGGILSGGGRERSGSKSYGSTGTTEVSLTHTYLALLSGREKLTQAAVLL